MPAHPRPDRDIDRFDSDPARSYTLSANYYTDPAVLDKEWERIFHRSWQLVGHVSSLTEPGDYLTAEIGDQRVFVIRSSDGELRSFFNVCLHRGHSLLSGNGRIGRRITCPYHAWAYDADGCLLGARMADRMADFDSDSFRLPSVAVEELCGFVFVNLDSDPESLSGTYPEVETAVRNIHAEPETLRLASSSTFVIEGNWKNVGDNLLECYHCHPAHRAFVDLIDMDTYRNDTFENWSIQSGAHRPDNEIYEVASGRESFVSAFLWPNLSIGAIPGQRGVLVFHFVPTAIEQTLQTISFYSPDGELDEVEQQAFEYFSDVLGPEDVALVEDVQVGLRSLGYHQGRFICIPDRPEISEHAVHHFHSMVRRALGVD